MAEYTITTKDLRDAENFLVQFQEEQVPEANLQVGGATRDFLVKGFAALYAFLRGEADAITAKQSLLRIQEELDDTDLDISQAVDEILSNWFITRKSGKYSYVTARLHFLQKRAQSIPLSTRFWRTNNAVFYLDATTDPYVISESQMLPVYDTTGELVDYVVDVPLKAASPGEGYDIDAGNFVRVQIAGGLPYFSYAENVEAASGGKGVEATSELLERAETAISVRNLINNRSCDSVLQEEFPTIDDTLTIGMGEAEMVRDLREEIAPHMKLHIGGHYDTYVGTPLVTVEENLTVGGYFARPDNIISVFRDPELTYDNSKTFTSLGVQPGHVIYIRSGIEGTPRGFPIVAVFAHEIHVSSNIPFTAASDEADTNAVVYSLGWFAPDFSEIDFGGGVYYRTAAPSIAVATENIPYGTSRRIQQPGKVVLSGRPVQDISWVEITDPSTAFSLIIDPATETLVFNERVNVPPIEQAEPSYTQYNVESLNPREGQSALSVNVVTVGYPTVDKPDSNLFDGLNLRIVYKTLEAFSNIHTYITNRNHRVACANQLLRARNPIWIELTIEYRKKPTASEDLDEEAAAKAVAKHINEFDPNDDLDVSDISTFVRQSYPDIIGAVFPLEAFYNLDSPDGQQAYFSTTDIISIFMNSGQGVALENGLDIVPPAALQEQGILHISNAQDLATWFTYLGVSDRTVKYRTTEDRITFVLRS